MVVNVRRRRPMSSGLLDGTARSASASRSRTTSRAAPDFGGGGRIGVQAALGHSDAPDVGRSNWPDATGARAATEDHLRRPAAEVDDDERAAVESNSPTAPLKDSSASSSTPLITSATAPGSPSPETVAVIAKKSSRFAPRPGSPTSPPSASRAPGGGPAVPRNPPARPYGAGQRSGGNLPVASTPSPSRTMRISRCTSRNATLPGVRSRSAISNGSNWCRSRWRRPVR